MLIVDNYSYCRYILKKILGPITLWDFWPVSHRLSLNFFLSNYGTLRHWAQGILLTMSVFFQISPSPLILSLSKDSVFQFGDSPPCLIV
jgi:hypothetical protein